jgi:hypothetical protein
MWLDQGDNQSAQSLFLVGKKIVNLFCTIEASEDRFCEEKYSTVAWQNEYQRFNLWADNLGLHHHGHSSLDYRLREAAILKNLVSGLLLDLERSLHNCKLFILQLIGR